MRRVFVTDGHSTGFVDAELPGTIGGRPGMDVAATYVEREVEYAAGRLPREGRLADLVVSSPVRITADRLPALTW